MVEMKSILLSGILLAATTAGAHAECSPYLAFGEALTGKSVWLAHNDPSHLSYHVSDYKGLRVPLLRQVGPTQWEPDGTTMPHGAKVTAVKPFDFYDSMPDVPRYFEVQAADGKIAVVSALNVMGFDFRDCRPSQVLSADDVNPEYRSQWMKSITVRLKPGARPLDYGGRWVDEQWVSRIAYADCREYDNNTSLTPKTTACSVVWQDGFEPPQYDESVPRDIYVSDDMVEQVVGQ